MKRYSFAAITAAVVLALTVTAAMAWLSRPLRDAARGHEGPTEAEQLSAASSGAGTENPAPMPSRIQHGVVYFLPDSGEESVRQLEAIRADGYNMVCIASWVWTVPTPGSALEGVARATLDWCERNGMAVWLLHNIQYGSPGEVGDVEQALTDPVSPARQTLEPWANLIKDYRCVVGVLLGNEVEPGGRELFQGRPRFLEAFRRWLEAQHGDIAALNRRWRTNYARFSEVKVPAAGEYGAIDVTRFTRSRFAHFYSAIIEEVLRPILGNRWYGSKGGASPYILRQARGYTVCSWDDLLANWPLWRTKMLCDTTGLPVYNSELHLYHDDYEYGSSPELSRYRYFTSALLGEWMTASFAWGGWKKPQIAAVHAATPAILKDLRDLEPVLQRFNFQTPAFSVLVTEGNEEGIEGHPPLELAYAHAATTGLPWSYLADLDLDKVLAPTVVVDSPWLTARAAGLLAELSATRRLVFVRRVPTRDEYQLPLPNHVVDRLRGRGLTIRDWGELAKVVPAANLPEPYREVVDVPYLWWSRERGHYKFSVKYPRLEARSATYEGRSYVAVINHTRETVQAPIPFVPAGALVTDLLSLETVDPKRASFGPFAVRVFEVG